MLRTLATNLIHRNFKSQFILTRGIINYNTDSLMKFSNDTLKAATDLKDLAIDKMVDQAIENSAKIFAKYESKFSNQIDVKLTYNLGPITMEVSKKI